MAWVGWKLNALPVPIIRPSSCSYGTWSFVIRPSSCSYETYSFVIRPSSCSYETCSFVIRPSSCSYETCSFVIRPSSCSYESCCFVIRPSSCSYETCCNSGFWFFFICVFRFIFQGGGTLINVRTSAAEQTRLRPCSLKMLLASSS